MNREQMIRTIPSFLKIFEIKTIQARIPSIPGLKSNGTELSVKKSLEIGDTSRVCPLFREFQTMLFRLQLDISGNFRNFLWNKKRPMPHVITCKTQRSIRACCWILSMSPTARPTYNNNRMIMIITLLLCQSFSCRKHAVC